MPERASQQSDGSFSMALSLYPHDLSGNYAQQSARKTDIFLDGGFFLDPPSAGRDQVDFAPRLKLPVLMVNGRYDFSFSLDRAQRPLFRMLGTPDADKRHVLLETPHDVSARRPELTQQVLAWLDHYLGPVRLR